jgi:hypothetical protein
MCRYRWAELAQLEVVETHDSDDPRINE